MQFKFNRHFSHREAEVNRIIKGTENALEAQRKKQEFAVVHYNEDDYKKHMASVKRVDDLWLEPNLATLCEEVRRVNPRVKFGVHDGCTRSSYGPMIRHDEVWVYLPDQPYALMRLGYKDYFTTSRAYTDNTKRYGVYSRMIENEKYKDVNDQYFMSMSQSRDTALKTAKKYMRAYAPQELVQVNLDKFQSSVRNETVEKNHDTSNASYTIRNHTDLMLELTNLVQTDYQFVTPSLKGLIEDYNAKRAAMVEHNNRARHAWFVHVYTRMGKQMFDVVEMFDVHKSSQVPAIQNPVTYDETTLPEQIAGGLAVLSMVDEGHRVPDVGMRATHTMFYVERV